MLAEVVLAVPDGLNPIGLCNSLLGVVAPYVTALLVLSFIVGLVLVVKRMIKRGATGAIADRAAKLERLGNRGEAFFAGRRARLKRADELRRNRSYQ